jgi:hypothetical protein
LINPNVQDQLGTSLIVWATFGYYLDDFLKLKNIDFKLPRADGSTALMVAALMGNMDAVPKL